MGIIKFGTRFKSRPVKSARMRRQRIKAQKKRLLASGMEPALVVKMDAYETRQAIKEIR